MTVSDLDQKIRKNSLGSTYFFYGEETFLLENKIKSIKKHLLSDGSDEINFLQLEGKKADLNALEEFAYSFPIFSEHKVAVVKNTGYFNNMKLGEFKRIKEITDSVGADTCIIFAEYDFDKKKEKNLSFIADKGGIVRFDFLSGNQAVAWLEQLFERSEKRISERDVLYIVQQCGPGLSGIYSEFGKLIHYVGEQQNITQEDIDKVIVRSTAAKIYDLFDDIIQKRRGKVTADLKNLLNSGEKPLDIMGLLSRSVSELLMVKQLKAEGMSQEEIIGYFDFKRPAFVVGKLYNQGRGIDDEFLRRMLYQSLEYDMAVKSGKLSDRAAVEAYVAQLLG